VCHPNCAAGIFYTISAALSILQFFCRKILLHQQFFTFACCGRSPIKVPNFPLWAKTMHMQCAYKKMWLYKQPSTVGLGGLPVLFGFIFKPVFSV
jgi:hypothetical protein